MTRIKLVLHCTKNKVGITQIKIGIIKNKVGITQTSWHFENKQPQKFTPKKKNPPPPPKKNLSQIRYRSCCYMIRQVTLWMCTFNQCWLHLVLLMKTRRVFYITKRQLHRIVSQHQNVTTNIILLPTLRHIQRLNFVEHERWNQKRKQWFERTIDWCTGTINWWYRRGRKWKKNYPDNIHTERVLQRNFREKNVFHVVHRLRPRRDGQLQTIIAKFERQKDKDRVLKAAPTKLNMERIFYGLYLNGNKQFWVFYL